MVRELSCDCYIINDLIVNNISLFHKYQLFFDNQCKKGIYQEMTPQQPYYTWSQGINTKKWFATKWYKCKICGCLCEFQYPDFPANGFIRKFPNGEYHERGF